jgi:hypothetical protein
LPFQVAGRHIDPLLTLDAGSLLVLAYRDNAAPPGGPTLETRAAEDALLIRARELAGARLDGRSLRRVAEELSEAPKETQLAATRLTEAQAIAERVRLNPTAVGQQAESAAAVTQAEKALQATRDREASLQAEHARRQSDATRVANESATAAVTATAARLTTEREKLIAAIAEKCAPELTRLRALTLEQATLGRRDLAGVLAVRLLAEMS